MDYSSTLVTVTIFMEKVSKGARKSHLTPSHLLKPSSKRTVRLIRITTLRYLANFISPSAHRVALRNMTHIPNVSPILVEKGANLKQPAYLAKDIASLLGMDKLIVLVKRANADDETTMRPGSRCCSQFCACLISARRVIRLSRGNHAHTTEGSRLVRKAALLQKWFTVRKGSLDKSY